MSELFSHRNALERIHTAIVETSKHRPLTRLEIRIRCMTAARPWRDHGIDRSTWYRRRARARKIISANIPQVVPDDPGGTFVVQGSHGWLYGSRSEAVQEARKLAQEQRP